MLRRGAVPRASVQFATPQRLSLRDRGKVRRPRSNSMKAVWNGVVVAESDDTVVVEGNHYFPEGSLKREFTSFSNHRSHCHWKGEAHYYSLFVNGEMNPDAVWYYPSPSEAAARIKGRVAFWKGVTVVE
jgi:uncharacterized protein (DUF427 family)